MLMANLHVTINNYRHKVVLTVPPSTMLHEFKFDVCSHWTYCHLYKS